MEIKSIIQKILSMRKLAIPKGTSPYGPDLISQVFGSEVEETCDRWFITCTHTLNLPASMQKIRHSEMELGFNFPFHLSEFLQICDGAKFFVDLRKHIRYHLFGTEELIEVNRELWKYFLSKIESYPEHQNLSQLNYVAFGDATNGDYYGIGLDGEKKNQVFLVHHELEYRPFLNSESDFLYYTIADTLEDRFRLIVATNGWGGRGEDCGPL